MRDRSIPVWEMHPRPTLAVHERTSLAARHYQVAWYYPPTFVPGVPEPAPIRLEHPYCAECREPWTDFYGCRTLRALQALACAEHDTEVLRRRVHDAVEAMARVGTLAHWRMDPAHHVWQVNFAIAEEILIHGGPEVIDHALRRMGLEMQAKLKELLTSPAQRMAAALAAGLADAAKGRG